MYRWLKGVGNVIEGPTGVPNGYQIGRTVPVTSVGNASGTVGLYGSTGFPQLASGTAGITAWTGINGASIGSVWFNGGSGAYYTFGDVVVALKNAGILKQ